jgi:hypothetical protein
VTGPLRVSTAWGNPNIVSVPIAAMKNFASID